jgi:hypothetical protein
MQCNSGIGNCELGIKKGRWPSTQYQQMRSGDHQPDIPARTFAFAARILRLVRALPRDVGGFVVARQLARSGTSVGANVEEAQAAHSRADFTR